MHSFNLLFVFNGLVVFVISSLLILQLLWSVEMEERVSKNLLAQTFILSLCMAEIGVALSFWPLNHILWSIILTSSLYAFLGIASLQMRNKLTTRLSLEYLVVAAFFLIYAFFTTSWSG